MHYHYFPYCKLLKRGALAVSTPEWAYSQASATALQMLLKATDSSHLIVKSSVFLFLKSISFAKISWNILIPGKVCLINTHIPTALIQQVLTFCNFASNLSVYRLLLFDPPWFPLISLPPSLSFSRTAILSSGWPFLLGILESHCYVSSPEWDSALLGCFKALSKWHQAALSILPLAGWYFSMFKIYPHWSESYLSFILTVLWNYISFFPTIYFPLAWSVCAICHC